MMNFFSLARPKRSRGGVTRMGTLVVTMLLTSLFSLNLYAQGITVSGKVSDANGEELPGVSVQVKGTTKGTQTDLDGMFTLADVPSNGTLVFSFIGMTTQEVAIGGRSTINVTMTDDAQALEEVVVIGYGTQKVKDATGAVSSLGSKDFNKGVINSPEQLLQGRVAGVQMTPNSGDPGAGVNLRIRGTTSVRGNNGPLYVVDGIPLDNSDVTNNQSGGGGFGNVASRNPLNFLNPADIENISILKDASAAAIYGSRGANGVVLITTKRGRSGAGVFNLSLNGSISTPAAKYDLLNKADFLSQLQKGGYDTSNKLLNAGSDTDWQKEIYRTAFTQNYNMSFGGGTDKTNYYFSLGYQDQQGIVKTTEQDRLQARINASHKLFDDKVNIGVALTTSKINDTYAAIGGNIGFEGNLISTSIKTNPTFPVYATDGSGNYFTTGTPSFRNPVSLLNQIRLFGPTTRTLANVFGTWKIVDGLTYKLNLGQDNSTGQMNTSVDPGTPGFSNAIPNNQGRALMGVTNKKTSTVEHTLNYVNSFGLSNIDAIAGFAYQKFEKDGFNVRAQYFIAPSGFPLLNNIGFVNASGTNKPYDAGSFKEVFDLQSYFGRVAYNYNETYYLTGTVRVDGSSKFGLNNKYGVFPAINGAVNLANMAFMENTSFDVLKLRAGWGITGNSEGFPINQSITTYIPDKDAGGIRKENVSNPDLKWEQTTSWNVGLDFTLLNGRLSGSLDYFNKGTDNLLFALPALQPDVATTQWTNVGANIVNKGFEVLVNYDVVRNNNFVWDASVNATFLKNIVEDLAISTAFTGNVYGQGLTGAYIQPIRVGYPLYGFFMPTFLGFDDKGQNKLSEDSPYQGSPLPKMTWGLTNNFNWGKWNASLFINGQTGGYIFNNTALALGGNPAIAQGNNTDRRWLDDKEAYNNGLTPSTRFLEKSDFTRISNLVLGRTFDMPSGSAFKSLNISFTGQNLLVFSKYNGLDPEVTNPNASANDIPSVGIDYISYPKARTFTLGINASF